MNTADIRNYAFQDAAGTIPAVNDGDPVRHLASMFGGSPLISTSNPPPVLRSGMVDFGSVTTGPAFPPEHFPKPKPVEPDEPTIVTG